MNLDRMTTLKDKMMRSANLGEVMDYFFDHFGDDTEFLRLGIRFEDPDLEAILLATVRELTGPQAELDNLLATRLQDQRFMHGGFTVLGKMGIFIYFEEIRTGIASVASLPAGPTQMARFRASSAHRGPSLN